jgi:hypothetical protein
MASIKLAIRREVVCFRLARAMENFMASLQRVPAFIGAEAGRWRDSQPPSILLLASKPYRAFFFLRFHPIRTGKTPGVELMSELSANLP